MKHERTPRQLTVVPAIAILALVVATAPGLASTASQDGGKAAPENTGADRSPSPVIELPREAGDGPDREVSVLLDDSHLKLAVLTLRRGTVLATHSAPVPTTIQVLRGSGVIHIDETPVEVSEGTLLALGAGAPHDARPREGSDLVLLVHYLRGGGPRGHSPDEH